MLDEGKFSGASISQAEIFITICQALSSQNSHEIANAISGWTRGLIDDLESLLDTFFAEILA